MGRRATVARRTILRKDSVVGSGSAGLTTRFQLWADGPFLRVRDLLVRWWVQSGAQAPPASPPANAPANRPQNSPDRSLLPLREYRLEGPTWPDTCPSGATEPERKVGVYRNRCDESDGSQLFGPAASITSHRAPFPGSGRNCRRPRRLTWGGTEHDQRPFATFARIASGRRLGTGRVRLAELRPPRPLDGPPAGRARTALATSCRPSRPTGCAPAIRPEAVTAAQLPSVA